MSWYSGPLYFNTNVSCHIKCSWWKYPGNTNSLSEESIGRENIWKVQNNTVRALISATNPSTKKGYASVHRALGKIIYLSKYQNI